MLEKERSQPRHPHLVLAYNKVIEVIKSCKTKEHLEGASRMVENFKILYKEVGYPKTLLYSLDRAIKIKKL